MTPDKPAAGSSPVDAGTDAETDAPTRCGFVAILGAPNAGKSTLVNQLVGTKVSIVTHKVQTTRSRIRGIVPVDQTQLILIDTPGIFAPKRRIDRAMVRAAWDGAAEADVSVLLIDAQKGVTPEVEAIIETLREHRTLVSPKPILVALNKIDSVRRDSLLATAAAVEKALAPDRILMISALSGDGCTDILADLRDRMPLSPWLYPADEVSDLPLRLLAAEVTREKVFINLHEELPYAALVTTDRWEEQRNGSVRLEQTIHVQRASQRPIVLGKGGSRIKALGQQARKELSTLLERDVHLFLHVAVRENLWDSRESYSEWGLDFDV